LVITPTLTLQGYAQLFSQNQHFFSFYQASSVDHAPIRLDDLKPVSVWPWRLIAGPAIDTFLVKWSYWWNL
jgi:hypothetical protein